VPGPFNEDYEQPPTAPEENAWAGAVRERARDQEAARCHARFVDPGLPQRLRATEIGDQPSVEDLARLLEGPLRVKVLSPGATRSRFRRAPVRQTYGRLQGVLHRRALRRGSLHVAPWAQEPIARRSLFGRAVVASLQSGLPRVVSLGHLLPASLGEALLQSDADFALAGLLAPDMRAVWLRWTGARAAPLTGQQISSEARRWELEEDILLLALAVYLEDWTAARPYLIRRHRFARRGAASGEHIDRLELRVGAVSDVDPPGFTGARCACDASWAVLEEGASGFVGQVVEAPEADALTVSFGFRADSRRQPFQAEAYGFGLTLRGVGRQEIARRLVGVSPPRVCATRCAGCPLRAAVSPAAPSPEPPEGRSS